MEFGAAVRDGYVPRNLFTMVIAPKLEPHAETMVVNPVIQGRLIRFKLRTLELVHHGESPGWTVAGNR